MHAFLGSDTTSHILGLNKNRFMKIAPNLLFDEAVLFNDRQVDKLVIIEAGEKILLSLIIISEAILDDARINLFHNSDESIRNCCLEGLEASL